MMTRSSRFQERLLTCTFLLAWTWTAVAERAESGALVTDLSEMTPSNASVTSALQNHILWRNTEWVAKVVSVDSSNKYTIKFRTNTTSIGQQVVKLSEGLSFLQGLVIVEGTNFFLDLTNLSQQTTTGISPGKLLRISGYMATVLSDQPDPEVGFTHQIKWSDSYVEDNPNHEAVQWVSFYTRADLTENQQSHMPSPRGLKVSVDGKLKVLTQYADEMTYTVLNLEREDLKENDMIRLVDGTEDAVVGTGPNADGWTQIALTSPGPSEAWERLWVVLCKDGKMITQEGLWEIRFQVLLRAGSVEADSSPTREAE